MQRSEFEKYNKELFMRLRKIIIEGPEGDDKDRAESMEKAIDTYAVTQYGSLHMSQKDVRMKEIFIKIILNPFCKDKQGNTFLTLLSQYPDAKLSDYFCGDYLWQTNLNQNYYISAEDALICAVVFNQDRHKFAVLAQKLKGRDRFSLDTFDSFDKIYPMNDLHRHLLLLAAAYNNLDMARYLLAADLDPNTASGYCKLDDYQTSFWQLDCTYPLHAAASAGHAEMVQLLLEYGAKPDQQQHGRTALHLAAMQNHKQVVRILLANEQGKLTVDAVTRGHKRTALFIATKYGNFTIANMLVDAGADKNLGDEDGTTPIEIATEQGTMRIVNLLFETGALLGNYDHPELRLFVLAAAHGHFRSCQFWLDKAIKKGQDINHCFLYEKDILSELADKGYVDILQLFIARQVNVNAFDSGGLTPLHHAAIHGRGKVIRLLMSAGANAKLKSEPSSSRETGRTAAGLAKNHETRDLIIGLMEQQTAQVQPVTEPYQTTSAAFSPGLFAPVNPASPDSHTTSASLSMPSY